MAQFKNIAILLLVAAILQGIEAADHTVGGSTGWTSSPSGGASFYSNWASNITFKENDTLVFNFVSGHTVAVLTKASFDSCNTSQSTQVLSTSPVRFTLNKTGEFYFACSIPGHCSSGQKLSVNVTGSSSSPAPKKAPSPAQGPSPPESGTTPSTPTSGDGAPPPSDQGSTPPSDQGSTPPPPPSSSSATSLAATFSVFIIVVLNLLV